MESRSLSGDGFQILLRDQGNGDIVNIDFILFDQMEQQVQGALKALQFEIIVHEVPPSDPHR